MMVSPVAASVIFPLKVTEDCAKENEAERLRKSQRARRAKGAESGARNMWVNLPCAVDSQR